MPLPGCLGTLFAAVLCYFQGTGEELLTLLFIMSFSVFLQGISQILLSYITSHYVTSLRYYVIMLFLFSPWATFHRLKSRNCPTDIF